jgi:hypothetical protein
MKLQNKTWIPLLKFEFLHNKDQEKETRGKHHFVKWN